MCTDQECWHIVTLKVFVLEILVKYAFIADFEATVVSGAGVCPCVPVRVGDGFNQFVTKVTIGGVYQPAT